MWMLSVYLGALGYDVWQGVGSSVDEFLFWTRFENLDKNWPKINDRVVLNPEAGILCTVCETAHSTFYKLLSSLFTCTDLRRVSSIAGKATRVHSLKLVTFDPYDIKEMHKCKAEKDLVYVGIHLLTYLQPALSCIGLHLCIFLEVIGSKVTWFVFH